MTAARPPRRRSLLVLVLALLTAIPLVAQAPAPTAADRLRAAIEAGDLKGALEFGQAQLPAHANDGAFREQLGRAFFILSEQLILADRPTAEVDRARRTAIAHLEVAASLGAPPPVRVHLAIGTLQTQLLEFAAAERTARAGLRHHPRHPGLRTLLARALSSQGRWEDAEAAWAAVLEVAPDDAGAAIECAETWNRRSQPCDAADRLRALAGETEEGNDALRTDWRVPYNIGRFEIACRRYEAAIPYLDTAAQLDPDNGLVAIERADMLYRVGRVDDARAALDAWLDRIDDLERPQQLQALYRRGRIAELDGDTARARDLHERTLALDPSHEGALQRLGLLLRRAGETERSDALLERFRRVSPVALDLRITRQRVRRNPGDAAGRVELVDLYLALPEPRSAQLELDELARRFPGHRELPRLRAALRALDEKEPR